MAHMTREEELKYCDEGKVGLNEDESDKKEERRECRYFLCRRLKPGKDPTSYQPPSRSKSRSYRAKRKKAKKSVAPAQQP